MKKILAMALALMMLSLAACGGKDEPKPSGSDKPTQSREPVAPDPGASQQTEQPSNTPSEEQSAEETAEDYIASVVDYAKGRHSENAFIYYDDSSIDVGYLTVWACEPIDGDDTRCTTTWYWGHYNRDSRYDSAKTSDLIGGGDVEASSVTVDWNDELTCYSYEMNSSWADEESRANDYTIAQARGGNS